MCEGVKSLQIGDFLNFYTFSQLKRQFYNFMKIWNIHYSYRYTHFELVVLI